MTPSDRWHINMCTALVIMSTATTALVFWTMLGGAVISLIASAVTSDDFAKLRRHLKN